MSTDNPKRDVLVQIAGVAKALGHAHRLEILEILGQGERSVDGLAEVCGLSVANASQHLGHLRKAGLVASTRHGQRILYRLRDESVIGLLMSLRRIAETNVAEMRLLLNGYFRERDALEPTSRDELLDQLRHGQVTLLDVRPEEEFDGGHIPGALNIPLGELTQRMARLPKGTEIVAYCRGPYCVFSFEAVAALREYGFQARRLEDGYPEWKAAGLPTDVTALV